MIKMKIKDHNCSLEVHGSPSDAIAELVIGVEQSIEAFSRITGSDKDVAAATVFALIKTRAREKERSNDKDRN